MAIGPTGSRFRSLGGGWAFGGNATKGSLTTALSGSNNDLTYTAVNKGSGSSSTRVRYVVSGNSTPLSVSVSGSDITVNVATDSGGAATSTATQVKAAVIASTPASQLVDVANAPSNDGSGVVAALGYTALSSGANFVIGYSASGLFSRTTRFLS